MGFDTITFMSDYGTSDEFVGVVHSVIRSIAPAIAVIDLTHEIPPHDVRAGGLLLARSAQYLCPGVVLAVVDPGVGTDRRGLAIEVGEGESVLVGPDNGLLASAVAMVGGATRAVSLTNSEYHLPTAGATFDGRDVFAPVAAHLCIGVELTEFGDLVDPATLTPGLLPVMREEDDAFVAEVLWVDRFGNCQLNVDPDDLEAAGPWFQLRWGDDIRRVRVTNAYDRINHGEIGLVIDSYGLISVAAARESAADTLGLHAGSEVRLVGLGDAAPSPTSPVELTIRRNS